MREMAYIFPGGNGFADHGWYLQKPTQTFVLNPAAGDSNEFLALKYDDELQYENCLPFLLMLPHSFIINESK